MLRHPGLSSRPAGVAEGPHFSSPVNESHGRGKLPRPPKMNGAHRAPRHENSQQPSRQSLRQARHGLHDVVKDHHRSEQNQEYKRRLIDPFFDFDADIAPNNPLDKQH